MSLLLDALKRAEQAKQESGETQPETLEVARMDLEPMRPTPSTDAAPPPLITRDRLPDISQSLEILADDLAPPPLLRRPKDARTGGTEAKTTASNARTAAAAEAQAAVRRVFQVKESPVDPKRPFYIALGVLCAVALSCAVYVWDQMQPRNAQPVQTNSAPSQSIVVSNTTPATQTPEVRIEQPYADSIVPPLSTSPNKARSPARAPEQNPSSGTSTPPAAPADASPVFSKTAVAGGLSLNQQAYAAFERGDLDAARASYQAALAQDPLNNDALLGLAALNVRSGRYEEARAHYLKVLEADPRNAHAQAGMIALRAQIDPAAAESRLKSLLSQQPESAFLNFALGNLYAGQNRWSEAQQAYFKAYVADPANADYAFNLAVGLDHLRQLKPAADYYQKALTLTSSRPGNFNRAQVENRLRELGQSGAP